jgi:hypothetical protein
VSARFLAPVLSIELLLTPSLTHAQSSTPSTPSTAAPGTRPWIVVGGHSTTLIGDCTNCDEGTYQHTGGLLVNAGISFSPQTDVGAEVLWVPAHLPTGEDLRSTFILATVQFRPWRTNGFFVKAGAGTAFIRNWVIDFQGTGEAPPFISTAFGLGIGAGWEWRTRSPLGVQISGSHHVAALGDLNTGTDTADNVIGNFWSVGAALVIR